MSGNSAFINRSLTSIRTELEFLKDSKVITPALFDEMMNKFPARYNEGQPPIDVGPSTSLVPINTNQSNEAYGARNPSSSNLSLQGPPPAYQGGNRMEMAEAMYNFQPNGPSDLSLYPGQRIQILEKVNNDWWRGKDMGSHQEGMFPSSYVKIINNDTQESRFMSPATNNYYVPPPQQQQQMQYSESNNYYPPTTQQQPFPPASTGYYQPPQQQTSQEVAQPQKEHNSNAVADGAKKFGSKLGNAAIFGAGASIGSNIVNSIF